MRFEITEAWASGKTPESPPNVHALTWTCASCESGLVQVAGRLVCKRCGLIVNCNDC